MQLVNTRRTLCALMHYYKRHRCRTPLQQPWRNRQLKTDATQISKLEKMRRSVRGRLVEEYSKECVDDMLQLVTRCFEDAWNR